MRAMATHWTRRRGDGWEAGYRFASGPKGMRRKTFRLKVDANAWGASQVAALNKGGHVDPMRTRLTVGQVAETYLARGVRRDTPTGPHRDRKAPTSAYQERKAWERALKPTFGDMRLHEVKPSVVEDWFGSLEGAPTTVNGYLNLLSRIFNTAVRDGDTVLNPASSGLIRRHRDLRPAERAKSAEMVQRLFDVVPDRYAIGLHLALGAGLRSGEFRGLTQDRVHIDRRLLVIDRQLLDYPGAHQFDADVWHHGRTGFGPPKQRRPRDVGVPARILMAINAHVAEYGTGAQDLIMTSVTGLPVSHSTWQNAWRAVQKAADAPWGVHQLRHCYATWSLDAGEDLANVSERLGHTRKSFTLDRYVKATEQDPNDITDVAAFRGVVRDVCAPAAVHRS